MISAVKLSKYLIHVIRERMEREGMGREDFDVTLSRLQKLLYYCQVQSLAATGEKIFSDKIEVKENRPFIESVYQEYKNCSGGVVPYDSDEDFDEVDDVTSSIVRAVICEKICMSDYALTYHMMRERSWPSWPECLKEN